MKVEEFIGLFVQPYEQKFRLYDIDERNIIFEGDIFHMPNILKRAIITSIDNIVDGKTLTINVYQ